MSLKITNKKMTEYCANSDCHRDFENSELAIQMRNGSDYIELCKKCSKALTNAYLNFNKVQTDNPGMEISVSLNG